MGNEISQFDIPDRQLPAGSAQAGSWSDIGEAKISRTIFGRTKVRVIRKQDKILRAWLLGALAMTVIAVAAWQGWVALQHSKMFAVLPPLSERISVSPPVYQPETTAPAAPRSPGKGRPESVIQTEIDSMLSNPKGRPPRPLPLNATEPMDATPVTAQPLIASKPQQVKPQQVKPQAAPLATNNGASTTQTTVTQSHPKTPAPAQTAAPAVATHPSTQPASPAVSTPAATHPAASKPAPVAAPAEPSSKKDAPASSAANNQMPYPATAKTQVNAQTQVNARGTAIIFVEAQDSAKP